MRAAIHDFLDHPAGADQRDKLCRTLAGDEPGTALERWRALCLNGLCAFLLAAGRDVTVVVGRRTDRKSGDFAVALTEERQ